MRGIIDKERQTEMLNIKKTSLKLSSNFKFPVRIWIKDLYRKNKSISIPVLTPEVFLWSVH